MDSIDARIISILQVEGRITMKELGQRVGLTSPATIERVKKLEESGMISAYQAVIDPQKVGYSLRAFIRVRADKDPAALAAIASEHPRITGCHRLAGSSHYLLDVVAVDLKDLGALIDEIGRCGEADADIVITSVVDNKQPGPLQSA